MKLKRKPLRTPSDSSSGLDAGIEAEELEIKRLEKLLGLSKSEFGANILHVSPPLIAGNCWYRKK